MAGLSALSTRLALVTGLVVSLTGLAGMAAKASSGCKPHVSAIAIHFRKDKAISYAKLRWPRQARKKYGVIYSFWSSAKSKSVSCGKLHNGNWKCTAAAKPCRPVAGDKLSY